MHSNTRSSLEFVPITMTDGMEVNRAFKAMVI
jgi:hypothetical protein